MAWTQFEFSRSWPWDEDSYINIWHLLRKCSREKQVRKWGSRTEKGEQDKQERNCPWFLSLRFHRVFWIINYILDLSHSEAKNGLSNSHTNQYLAIGFLRNAVPFRNFCFSVQRTRAEGAPTAQGQCLERGSKGIWMIPRDVCYMWRQP